MVMHCGLIELATGDLIRAGYADFTNDQDYDPTIHGHRMDVPEPGFVRDHHFGGPEDGRYHRWTGSEWTIIIPDEVQIARNVKYALIDTKTQELIALGFSHAGKNFSLSANAQRYWTGLFLSVIGGLVTDSDTPPTFPMEINTVDDQDTHDVLSVAEVTLIYGTMLVTVKGTIGSGTTLKDAVRAALTVEAVEAIADPR